jgi:hypothetical protein
MPLKLRRPATRLHNNHSVLFSRVKNLRDDFLPGGVAAQLVDD